MNKSVHIEDPETFQKKLQTVKKDGKEDLHIVADFDRTLTKAFVKGKKVLSTYAYLREGNYLTPEYAPAAYALFDKYHPFEMSNNLSLKEKSAKMVEWWKEHFNLMIKCGMNKGVIDDIIKKGKVNERKGTFTLLDFLHDNNIPLLIFSAGLGDIIKGFLEYKEKLYPNTHIISNFYEFDENGIFVRYASDFIHTFNKNEFAIRKHPYYKEVAKRKNVILLGDMLGDLGMTAGMEHDTTIKIGFLNYNVEENFEKYAQAFDLLILNDGPMDYVNNLLKDLVSV